MTTHVDGIAHKIGYVAPQPVYETIPGEGQNIYFLHDVALVVTDRTAAEEAARVVFWDRSEQKHFPDCVTQLIQEGKYLKPERGAGEHDYMVYENQTLRVIGPTTPEGTAVITVSYERPASTLAQDRK